VFARRCVSVRNRPQPFVRSPYGRAYGKFCRRIIFGCFQRFDASFRVAGVALCDIQTCFVTCRKSFCVAGAILLRRFPKIRGSFRGRRSTLEASIDVHRHFAWQAQHFRRVALAGVALFDIPTLHSTLYTLHSTLHTLHSSPHSTLYTPLSTLHTLHFTLYTLNSTLYTPNFTF